MHRDYALHSPSSFSFFSSCCHHNSGFAALPPLAPPAVADAPCLHFFCWWPCQASYSMPAHDLNGVPAAMFPATHFYFSLYHVAAAKALRWAVASFEPGPARRAFVCALVAAMAYSTAFTESATISAYPCYSFKDVHQVGQSDFPLHLVFVLVFFYCSA